MTINPSSFFLKRSSQVKITSSPLFFFRRDKVVLYTKIIFLPDTSTMLNRAGTLVGAVLSSKRSREIVLSL